MSNESMRRSPLHATHEEHGATFVTFDDYHWPDHFGDAAAEYWAVRRGAGLFDACALPKLHFRGPDALAAADWVFTNDMLSLTPGQARYAPIVDEAGKMISDGIVYKHAHDHAWVTTTLESDLEHIEAIVGRFDVEIEPFTTDVAQIALQGPGSRALLGGLASQEVAGLGYFRFSTREVDVAGVPCFVSRTGYSGELGYELFCPPEDAARLWTHLLHAGARPYGLGALEPLRIEAGLLFIGLDYTQHETSPFDLSLDRVVVLDRHDFHGRAALVEEARHPSRRMKTLVLDAEEVPAYGSPVTSGGRRVGTLTSPCRSPELDRVVGLAILETPFAAEGTRLEVEADAGPAPATVGTFPIYDPNREKPRT